MLTGIQWSVASSGTAQKNGLGINPSMASSCIDPCPELSLKCSSALALDWSCATRSGQGLGRWGGCVFERGKQESLCTIPSAALGCWGHKESGREALPPPHAHRAGKGDLYRGWAAHRTIHDAMEKSFLLCWWSLMGTCAWALAPLLPRDPWPQVHQELQALQRASWIGFAVMCLA